MDTGGPLLVTVSISQHNNPIENDGHFKQLNLDDLTRKFNIYSLAMFDYILILIMFNIGLTFSSAPNPLNGHHLRVIWVNGAI